MLIILLIILTFLGIARNKSKSIFVLLVFFAWILLGFCSDYERFDYVNYATRYLEYGQMDIQDYKGTEVGYFIINKIFYVFNIDFEHVYKIFVLLIFLCVSFIIIKNTNRICMPLICFIWYPGIMHVYNTREGLATCLVLFAIQALINKQKRYIEKFVFLILLATTIHNSSIFYLIVLMVKYKNKMIKKLFFVTVFISAFLVGNFPLIRSFIGATRFDYYFKNNHVSLMTIALLMVWQLSLFMVLYIIEKLQVKKKISSVIREFIKKDNYNEVIMEMFFWLLIVCPLYMYTFTFIRLTRGVLIYLYIYFARWVDIEYGMIKQAKQCIWCVWTALTIFGMNVVVKNDFEQVIKKFFMYNNFGTEISKYPIEMLFFGSLFLYCVCKDLRFFIVPKKK